MLELMINPTELRRNNWVENPDSSYRQLKTGAEIEYMSEECDGIRLTVKILHDAGFLMTEPSTAQGGDAFEREGIVISIVGNELIYEGSRHRISLDYVHQLQNLWYVLKEGKEIEIRL